jgi:hypothetical protein
MRRALEPLPIPDLLHCPRCLRQHVAAGGASEWRCGPAPRAEVIMPARYKVEYTSGRDRGRAWEEGYDEFTNGDLFSVESITAVQRLGVGETYEGVEIAGYAGDAPAGFKVTRLA